MVDGMPVRFTGDEKACPGLKACLIHSQCLAGLR